MVEPLSVRPCSKETAQGVVVAHHYLRRRTSINYAFGLYLEETLVGVITFGTPPSRHLQLGVLPSSPDKVIELNRLYVQDQLPRNTESWFISKALSLLPPLVVVSYADTAVGHQGYVYRASNFLYAGWTDMDRKTPRFDYITPGKHTRSAFRAGGSGTRSKKVRRKPKVRYWTVTGSPKDKRELRRACRWPSMSWKDNPPPGESRNG